MTTTPSTWLAAALLAATAFAAPSAQAFCVYNQTDHKIHVEQHEARAGKFTKVIRAHDSACCNYQDTSCNPGGKRTKRRWFFVTPGTKDSDFRNSCGVAESGSDYYVPMEAGGYMKIKPNADYKKTIGTFSDRKYIVWVYTHDNKLVDGYPCPGTPQANSVWDYLL